MPRVTQALIIANALAFFMQAAGGGALFTTLALWPVGPQFAPWQIVTYAFLHGSVSHLVFNMFGLYMFGQDLERVWGPQRYLLYYAVSVVSAAAVMLLIPPIPMPAWLFATLYGIVELVLGVTGTASGVAHFAHLGGMLGGYLLIWHWRTNRRRRA
jgi:membrane associated rhomboid family serine protease